MDKVWQLNRNALIPILIVIFIGLRTVVPAFSTLPGDNGKFVFVREIGGHAQIFTANTDWTEQVQLTHDSTYDNINPAWSPDGSRIAFVKGIFGFLGLCGGAYLFVMDEDGSNQTQLTNDQRSCDIHPSWSPDGSKIVFNRRSYDNKWRIWSINADGSSETNLSCLGAKLCNLAATDLNPSWSPDGSKIAFGRLTGNDLQVFVMNSDGSGQHSLTNSGDDDEPDWSPDGSKIAFASERDGSWEIYVMNADGSAQRRLTRTELRTSTGNQVPRWSPDGSKIIFSSDRDGMNRIYVMNGDGSDQKILVSDPTIGSAVWQPQKQYMRISVSSNLSGISSVSVDGEMLVGGMNFSWRRGESHVISVESVVLGQNNGTRYRFAGWSDGVNATTRTVIATRDMVLSARYVRQYLLSVQSEHGKTTGSGWYDEGTIAYAGVNPAGTEDVFYTWMFADWSGDASGNSYKSNPIVMRAPKTAQARWFFQFTVAFWILIGAGAVTCALVVLKKSGSLSRRNRYDKATEVVRRTSAKTFCINCGAELSPGSKFCNKCGSAQS
jgi:Tol biopolymer transport system component/ribosomal protein L40E